MFIGCDPGNHSPVEQQGAHAPCSGSLVRGLEEEELKEM